MGASCLVSYVQLIGGVTQHEVKSGLVNSSQNRKLVGLGEIPRGAPSAFPTSSGPGRRPTPGGVPPLPHLSPPSGIVTSPQGSSYRVSQFHIAISARHSGANCVSQSPLEPGNKKADAPPPAASRSPHVRPPCYFKVAEGSTCYVSTLPIPRH